ASVSRWFGPKERARALAVAYSGNQVGPAVGGAIAATLLAKYGWQAVFYCIGGGSLLYTLAWLIFYPDKQRFKDSAARRDASKQPASREMSWGSLFRHRSTWGIAFGQFGYLY